MTLSRVIVQRFLLPAALSSLSFHGGSALAQADDPCAPSADHSFGPHFDGIEPAATIVDSLTRLEARQSQVLRWYANRALPAENTSDDPEYDPATNATNPRLNSRDDVRILTDRTNARIVLGCGVTDTEEILLDPTTQPFSLPGTSSRDSACYRDGDYDFALMNLLQLAYIARAHPGSLSEEAERALLEKLLNVRGPIRETTYEIKCSVEGPLKAVRYGVWLELDDTENHILMTQIARYLTNQLLAEQPAYAGDERFDNARNGNTRWMLEHLAMYMREHFYEYNSRPYQAYTVLALNVLHNFAADPEVTLATKMVLDVVSAWTALETDHLRRFAPFRRQPIYVDTTVSSMGDGEVERMAFLVGNYDILDNPARGSAPNYLIESGQGRNALSTAVVSSYRLDDLLLDLTLREDGESRFFVGNHDVIEMYASSAHALISAGGHASQGVLPTISLARRPWIVAERDRPGLLRRAIAALGKALYKSEGENGWSRPTTVIPSQERSNDSLDMMRFEGHRDPKQAAKSENMCVAPGFACGLAFTLGRRVEAVKDLCSVMAGDFRFFDFTRGGSCPDYGFYAAIYERPCDSQRCRDRADNYAVLEVAEPDASLDFQRFRQAVLENNPRAFSSTGVHTYNTVTGRQIKFEVAPPEGQSSLVQVDEMRFDRDYRTWPMARGDTMQSTTPGRVTLDSPGLKRRLILDMTKPAEPRRLFTTLPLLRREKTLGGEGGRFFDDGGAVIPNQGIQSIAVASNLLEVSGMRVKWRSGLEALHGSGKARETLELAADEVITEVGLGASSLGRRINRLRIKTSKGRVLSAGRGREQVTYTAAQGEHIVAFHGRAGDALDQLGVIVGHIREPSGIPSQGATNGANLSPDAVPPTEAAGARVAEASPSPAQAQNGCSANPGILPPPWLWLLLIAGARRRASSRALRP